MKYLAFSTAALLALTLMGGCSNNSTTTDTTIPPVTNDPIPAPAPTLSCTASFGTLPTAEQLTAYAGTYLSEEGTYDENTFEFIPNGTDVTVTFSDTGLFTYNGTAYSPTQVCFVDNTDMSDMIFLEFENGSHIDLFTGLAITGSSPVDPAIFIKNTLPI